MKTCGNTNEAEQNVWNYFRKPSEKYIIKIADYLKQQQYYLENTFLWVIHYLYSNYVKSRLINLCC